MTDERHSMTVFADIDQYVCLECTCGWRMQADYSVPMAKLVAYANSHLTAATS